MMNKPTLPILTSLVFLFGTIEPVFARFHRDEIPSGIPWIVYLIGAVVIWQVLKLLFGK